MTSFIAVSFKSVSKIIFILSSIWLVSCVSNGPATSYYALFSNDDIDVVNVQEKSLPSIGVGPIVLPGYLDSSGIVSRNDTQKINVSGYHVWAEPQDNAIARVISGNLNVALKHDDILLFPWDTRTRPELQLTVVFEQFDGVRGEMIKLKAKWHIFSNKHNKIVLSGRFVDQVASNGQDYNAYIYALNKSLENLSLSIANELIQ